MNEHPYRSQCHRCLELQNLLLLEQIKVQKLEQKLQTHKTSKLKEIMFKFWVTVLLLGLAIIIGHFVYGYAKRPITPEVCYERVEIISTRSNEKKCGFGGKIIIEETKESSSFLFRCICPSSESKK